MDRANVVDWTREAISNLIEVEQLWIESTPDYELNDHQKKKLKKKLEKTKERINRILEVYFEDS